ncbi:thiamine pyrophosphate-dependent enzyme [Candidatus Marinimicrobia bacterium]|nr:thiamine pyrophosphate-dependent enzyme [Candidatus Neomarinimicrobiota bacterium]
MNKFLTYKKEIKDGILIRAVEEKLLELFSEGKLNGTVHTCVGQELTGVFVSKYLIDEDHIVSNHRGHGHYLSKFKDIQGLIGEVMGKKSGCSGGYGGSQHLVNKNYLSNGIQGGMLPIAAGISLYFKLEKLNNISVAYIGDGTLGEGILYETINIASKWSLPLLIVLENNSYAQSTSIKQSFSGNLKKTSRGIWAIFF